MQVRAIALTIAVVSFCATPAFADNGTGGADADAPLPEAETRSATTSVDVAPTTGTIRRVQRRLHLTADGIYGPQTRRAVRRFQKRRHLAVTGRLTARTLSALHVTPVRAASVTPTGDVKALLERIAECESGGEPTFVSPDGKFRGKYQFMRETWKSVGGSGDPAAAAEAEQDQRALALYQREGLAPWPVCGRKASQA